jgi:hypothetical protein
MSSTSAKAHGTSFRSWIASAVPNYEGINNVTKKEFNHAEHHA